MNIIPIYKTNKGLDPSEYKAFRAVALAETLFKLAESVFLDSIRDIIEEKMGFFQHA